MHTSDIYENHAAMDSKIEPLVKLEGAFKLCQKVLLGVNYVFDDLVLLRVN